MRFVDGEDHFEGGAAVVQAAARLAVLLDRLHQVADDPNIALAKSAVLDGLRFAEAGARDRLPRRFAAGGEPARVVQMIDGRQTSRRELDDAARALDREAETIILILAARALGAGEMADDA